MEETSVISLQELSVFQKNKLVLAHVNLQVTKGEFVYLIGKTGSGKSSLLEAIFAELPVEAEKATVCGFDLLALKKNKIPFLRRKMGIIFQDYRLLEDRTIEDNLLFVLKATGWKDSEAINKRIMEVMSDVDLIAKLKARPHQLSGGEQQRVAIARALLNNPELILADEPTGNLDPETSNEIMRLLLKICQEGRAVIMATHNYNLIHKFPGRVVKCEEGSIIGSDNKPD
ncbi:Cell-division-associated, ABC-transporter-like signaling protein FtsE [hydrothermal vent metagenome]|uniref:Cell-division-associated, ABC-transporter-like signaling protein FtsE n=1 Tax=hydrothermal vent metagenome TaxID=652676 RepID=A0A3B0UPU4_9ZZZZ